MSKTANETFDPLNLDNQLCFALYACSHEVMRRYTPLLAELDLTYTQYIAMMALWESEPLSVKELGERLKLDSGTLTPMLKKMEAKGLVSRCRDAKDERRLVVSLTDKGRNLRESALRVPMEMGKCVDLEPDEAQELQRLLHKVLSSVEDI
ncbi:MAG: MarR family transcriptional regulator [Eggerthellaceae bacterium]|nr:MarR family transcriptional regulator [Eggerthellaceae bacterium]